jgi:hypothetical protein
MTSAEFEADTRADFIDDLVNASMVAGKSPTTAPMMMGAGWCPSFNMYQMKKAMIAAEAAFGHGEMINGRRYNFTDAL